MNRALGKLWLPALLVPVCIWLAFRKTALGDYKVDAGPAVYALSHGDFTKYFSWTPVMGPLGTLFQTPFSYLGSDELARCQWGSLGCLLALAGLGWYLSEVARRRGMGPLARTLIAGLCVFNPLTVEVLVWGHPEELLTAALAIGAVVAACEGRAWPASILLGLAIATKQWALIAIFPVLMVLPAQRARSAGVAAAIVVALNLPYAIANSGALLSTSSAVATGGHTASIWSLWYAASEKSVHHIADLNMNVSTRDVPSIVQPLTHPLIAVLVFAVPLALWAWRGRWRLGAGEAMALFTLLALLRCVLDPNDNAYYHFSLLAGLIAWDAVAPPGRLPLRALIGTAIALLLTHWAQHLTNLVAFNTAYLAVMLGGAVLIGATLFRREPETGKSAETVAAPTAARA